MKRKRLIIMGIGVAVVIIGILGFSFIHSDTDAVETMAETNMNVAADDFPAETAEKNETTEEEPPMEETTSTNDTVLNDTDAEPETEFAQETGEEQESPEPDITETAQTENLEEIDIYMYTTSDLKMRTGGSTESDVIEVIPYGTQIHLTARTEDDWYRTERSEIGYVSGKYLSEEEPAKQTAQPQNQNLTDAEFQNKLDAYFDSIGGGTDLSNLPSSEYNPNADHSNLSWIHAE